MLRERSASPALMQALCLARSFSGVVSPAHTAQHTGPERRAGGCVLCGICAGGSGQHLPPSSLPYPLPAFPCPSLPMPSKHTRNSPVSPSMLLARTFPAKFPCSGVAVQCVDVFPMTVYKPFGAGVCPGVCGVSGSSGAGIRSTTEVLSVTQHQLDTFSSHACDVRLH